MGKQGKKRAKEHRAQRLQEIFELRKIPYSPLQRWWSSEMVATVIGANRGIGYEVAQQLAGNGLCVILTSRDADRGREAADALQERGLNVDSYQLDVLDVASVESFVKWVNNAGVNFNIGSDNSIEFAEKVIATNYYGTKQMIENMIPMMKPSASGACILNVSSRLGRVNGRRNRIGDAILREQLLRNECLFEELFDGMVVKFLEQFKQGS